MKKTILLVAIPDSIHTYRWIKQMDTDKWDVHLFSSIGGAVVSPDMAGAKFHHLLYFSWKRCNIALLGRATPYFARAIDFIRRRVIERVIPDFHAKQLARLIRKIRPDLVHSMEIQGAGYLTLKAKKQSSGVFPPWLVTNWGSDIFLYGRTREHRERIREVLENSEYYSCECERDVGLARVFGFKGQVMPVLPNTGGFQLGELEALRDSRLPADRKVIMLKGYQHWAGRALVGLRALERCADLLSGYEIVIYSAEADVMLAAELFFERVGVPVRVLPHKTSHNEMLEWHARARISIGLSISDAISTSLLEAMVMGSFPIQSCTACADEWIRHGVSGMIVPPEDPDIIEMALRTALTDDELVNNAAAINWRVVQARLDSELLKQKTVEMYSSLVQNY